MAWFKMKRRDRVEGRVREWAGEKKVEWKEKNVKKAVCKGKKEWFKNETQWKNFTRGTDCLSRTFPFQHHQRQQNLHMLRFLSLHSLTLSLSTSVLFLSKRHLKCLTFKGDLIVVFLFCHFSFHKARFAVSRRQMYSKLCCEIALIWDKDEPPYLF